MLKQIPTNHQPSYSKFKSMSLYFLPIFTSFYGVSFLLVVPCKMWSDTLPQNKVGIVDFTKTQGFVMF